LFVVVVVVVVVFYGIIVVPRWDLIRQKFGDAFVALSSGEQSFAQLCAHTKMKRF
jgi:hypothetical protein